MNPMDDARPDPPAEPADPGQRGTVRRILVVDDEAMLREALRDVLGHLGFEVVEAEDGPGALALLQARGPEIGMVILDMTMPGMQGTEVLARLREMPGPVAGVPVLLASGYSREDLSASLAGLAPTCFLRKPFTMGELSRRISECLDGRDLPSR